MMESEKLDILQERYGLVTERIRGIPRSVWAMGSWRPTFVSVQSFS